MKIGASFFSLLYHHRRHIPHPTSPLFFSSIVEQTPKPQFPNKTLKSYPNEFIPQFFFLAKALNQNPRNFKALSQLDSLLSQSQFFDPFTSVTIIEGLCKLKKLNRAKDLIFHLKVSPHFAFSLVFDCLVKDGKLDDVEAQWGEISNGCEMNLSDYVIDVCKFGEFDEILRVCERVLMGSRVLRMQCYVALIGVLCRYNEGLMAKSVLHEMYCRSFKVDCVTYIVIFQCLCRNGDLDEADWVLRKMIEEDFDVDMCIYESFMLGLCKLGRFREASKLFGKLMKREHFSGSKAEFFKEGRRVIFQLNYEGVLPEIMVYEMYFRSLCASGKLDDAEVLLKKMMRKRTVAQVCVYGSFIKALFRAGREEDALKFFRVECKKGLVCSDELARFVFVQHCEKGGVDNAMNMFDEFSRKGALMNSVDHCNLLLGSLWGAERILEAERYFERMKSGDLAPPNLATYRAMVHGYCNRDNIRKALDIFEEMLSNNIHTDRFIYEAIITSLCKQGWLAEAYEYLNSMTSKDIKASYRTWKRVSHSLIDEGELHLD